MYGTYSEEDSDEEFLDLMLHLAFPRQPKVYRERVDYFTELRDYEFIQRFRLSKAVVLHIVDKIRPKIQSMTTRNHAVTPEQKVLLTLRYYATGSMLRACGDFIGVHISTASRVVKVVSYWIASLRPEYVRMPETDQERKETAKEFYSIAKFPLCIGAIDCTHIRIRSPGGNNAETHRNRKGWFSINVQTVSDAKLRIRSIVARWPGSAHDALIFRNSTLKGKFENKEFGEYVLVGDSGYAVSNYLLTPLREPTTPAEDLYNESLIFTRNPVERSYGVWKRRFPILSLGINIDLKTAMIAVVATAVLHNIACHFGSSIPRVTAEEEYAINASIFQSTHIMDNGRGNTRRKPTEQKRRRLINYFNSLLQPENL